MLPGAYFIFISDQNIKHLKTSEKGLMKLEPEINGIKN